MTKISGTDSYGQAQPENVVRFLQAIADVCYRHGLSLSHEDGHGAFQVEAYDMEIEVWRNEAVSKVGSK